MSWIMAPLPKVWMRKFPGEELRLDHADTLPCLPQWLLNLKERPFLLLWATEPDWAHVAKVVCCSHTSSGRVVGPDWAWLAAGLSKLSPGHWCLELLNELPCSRWVLGLLTTWHTKQEEDFGSSLCGAQPNNTASSVGMCSVGLKLFADQRNFFIVLETVGGLCALFYCACTAGDRL